MSHFGGRPPHYETLEDILPALQQWEESIVRGKEKPSLTGLTLALGFADKSSVYDYAKKPEFSHPIKKALLIVEHGYEKGLNDGNCTGAIFALKNFGWVDKQHTTLTGANDGPVQITGMVIK